MSSKFNHDDPRFEDMAARIHENREMIDNSRRFWRTYAVLMFAFLGALLVYATIRGTSLWEETIAVNRMHEEDIKVLLGQLGESKAELSNKEAQVLALRVEVEKQKRYGMELKSDYAQLANPTRQFILRWYNNDFDAGFERNSPMSWWTSERMTSRTGAERAFYGRLIVERLNESWRGMYPRSIFTDKSQESDED